MARVGDRRGELLDGAGALGLLGSGRVGLDRDDRGALGDLRLHGEVAGEHALRGHRSLLHVDGVGDQAGLELDREAAGDLLALRGGRDQDRGRRGLLGELLQRLGLGGHQVALDLRVVDDVDLLGAVLLDLLGHLGGLVGRADEDGRRLTEPLGDGEQLVRRLLDRAVDVVDENQNFRHRYAPQMNFLEARNSVSALAPEPSSSLTISPAVRGGRAVVSTTSVQAAPGRPRRRRRRGRSATRSRAASSSPP